MNVFLTELKKIWNRRILGVILLLGILTYFAFLSQTLTSLKSLVANNPFGVYLEEMFDRYGPTLEPEELADFDIPGKQQVLVTEMNEIIRGNQTFEKNGITSFSEYQSYTEQAGMATMSVSEREAQLAQEWEMTQELGYSFDTTPEEGDKSLLRRFESLEELNKNFSETDTYSNSLITIDARPMINSAAKEIQSKGNSSLIPYSLTQHLSIYATSVGIFSAIAIIALLSPFLITDRMRQINYIQYASRSGRRVFGFQCLASVLSGIVLGLIIVSLFFGIFFLNGYMKYWDTPIQAYRVGTIFLPNITLGQYTYLLGGMILLFSLSAAGLIFLLSRFSLNIVTLLIKTVPAALGLIALLFFSTNMAFSNHNMLANKLFMGRVLGLEFYLSLVAAIISLLLALVIVWRERRTDLA